MSASNLPSILPKIYSRHHPHGSKAKFIYGPYNNPICFIESPNRRDSSPYMNSFMDFYFPFKSNTKDLNIVKSAQGLGSTLPPEMLMLPTIPCPVGFTKGGQLTTDAIRALDYFKGLSSVSKHFYGANQEVKGNKFGLQPLNESWRDAFRDFCSSIYDINPGAQSSPLQDSALGAGQNIHRTVFFLIIFACHRIFSAKILNSHFKL